MMTENKPVAKQPMNITMQGYEVIEKTVKPCATSARILVPKEWIGKKVRTVLLEPLEP